MAAAVSTPLERGCLRGIHNLFYFISNYYSFMHKEITALYCHTRRSKIKITS